MEWKLEVCLQISFLLFTGKVRGMRSIFLFYKSIHLADQGSVAGGRDIV